MKNTPATSIWIEYLPDSLWSASPVPRSRELNCLYVDRYHGRHNARSTTSHSCWEFLCTVQGAGELLFPGGKISLGVGCVCLIPPELEHIEKSHHRMDTIWVGFTGNFLHKLPANSARNVVSHTLAGTFELMHQKTISPNGGVGPELDGLTRVLLSSFWRECESSHSSELEDRMDWAAQYLRNNYGRTISMSELAEACGCSEGHFYRSFHRRVGVSPRQFLESLRMEQAVKLLHFSDARVEDIAREVGYDDALYFSRVFRKNHRLSPSQFRSLL